MPLVGSLCLLPGPGLLCGEPFMFDPDAITAATFDSLVQHYARLHQALAHGQGEAPRPGEAERGQLASQIMLLCTIANDGLGALEPEQQAKSEATIQLLLNAFASGPLESPGQTFSVTFWQTPLGQLIAHSMSRMPNDFIGTIQAARILYPNEPRERAVDKRLTERIRRLIQQGRLAIYPNVDPSGGAQGGWLFRRRDVERLRSEGLHEGRSQRPL